MKTMLSNKVIALWDFEHLPIAALVGNRCATLLSKEVPQAYTARFSKANKALLEWWPDRRCFLSEIYEVTLRECWEAFYEISAESRHGESGKMLMSALYIQLSVFRRFEDKDASPSLGNDIRDIIVDDFVCLLEYVQQRLGANELLHWNKWFDELLRLDGSQWKLQQELLYESY